MREIKFRAWLPNSKEQEKMVYDIGVVRGKPYFENSRIVYEGGKNTDRDGSNNYKFEFYLMQFTGLKDKKGKEIYEGDIVKGGDCSGNFEVVFGEYYSECYSRHFGWKINTEWTEEFNWEKLEVIGNIYENPELTT